METVYHHLEIYASKYTEHSTSGNIWLDVEQTWYILEGCFMAEDSYLADSSDSLVRDFGGQRIQMKFLVSHRLDDDSFTVMHVTPEEGTC